MGKTYTERIYILRESFASRRKSHFYAGRNEDLRMDLF